MKAIGDYAFSSCSSLKNITISSSLTLFENYTFQSCSLFGTVAIGEHIKVIGNYA